MPVYWLRAGDSPHVKVGYAADVSARIKFVQTGCPWPLTLLRTEPGDRATEAALHHHYRHHHARGEWFSLTADDVAVDMSAVEQGVAAARTATARSDTQNALASNIKSAMTGCGLNINSLALRAGLKPDGIRDIWRKGVTPSASRLASIATVLGTTTGALLHSPSRTAP